VHAFDRGYWQLYLQWRGFNVSLEWSGTNAAVGRAADQQLSLLATVVDCPPGSPVDTLAGCDGTHDFDTIFAPFASATVICTSRIAPLGVAR